MRSGVDIRKCRCVRNLSTNLILHHGVANTLNHVAELIRIFGVGQELCDFAPLREREEVLEDVVQFANQRRIRKAIETGECEATVRGPSS